MDERVRLEKERNRLKAELSAREKQATEAEQQLGNVRSNAAVELRRISTELEENEKSIETIREEAIIDLFRDIVNSPAQISLMKLLTLDEDTELRWLLPLSYYLHDQVGLRLVGDKHERLMLTPENCDNYTLNEQVSLPCEVQITKRGFAIGDVILQRPEVTTQIAEDL
jgi:hypothetical protein